MKNIYTMQQRAEAGIFNAEAVRAAANYEATLYKLEYKHGKRISSALLYDPFKCFDKQGG